MAGKAAKATRWFGLAVMVALGAAWWRSRRSTGTGDAPGPEPDASRSAAGHSGDRHEPALRAVPNQTAPASPADPMPASPADQTAPAPAEPAPASQADPMPASPGAAVPAPESTSDGRRWADPVDGGCPDGYPIKVNERSGIYHVPGGLSYERTNPTRCYADQASAEADGFRRSKR